MGSVHPAARRGPSYRRPSGHRRHRFRPHGHGHGSREWAGCSELIVRHKGGASMQFDSLLRWMHGWWLDSPHHEPWMRDGRYTHVGYGFAWSSTGVPYAVTVIAEKN